MEDEGLIAQNVRRRMRAMGLGQKALALKAELNETYVRDLLKGKSRNPRQGHLQKLAVALKCLVSDLTGEPTSSGAEATLTTNRLRRDLFVAFDALDERDQETALRIVQSLHRHDPPTSPSGSKGADPSPFPGMGGVQKKPLRPTA